VLKVKVEEKGTICCIINGLTDRRFIKYVFKLISDLKPFCCGLFKDLELD
jgi:hypothetical protein